jgi:hypothetical protein
MKSLKQGISPMYMRDPSEPTPIEVAEWRIAQLAKKEKQIKDITIKRGSIRSGSQGPYTVGNVDNEKTKSNPSGKHPHRRIVGEKLHHCNRVWHTSDFFLLTQFLSSIKV